MVHWEILVFRKRGRLPGNLQFIYKGNIIEIVTKFCYLGIVFTSGGSSFETQKTLSGQALKAIFTLNNYSHNFTALIDRTMRGGQYKCHHVSINLVDIFMFS